MLRYGDDTSSIRMGEYNEDGRLRWIIDQCTSISWKYQCNNSIWLRRLNVAAFFDWTPVQVAGADIRRRYHGAKKKKVQRLVAKKGKIICIDLICILFFKLFETTSGEDLCSMGSTFLVDRPMSISNSLISVDWKGEKTGEKHEEKTLLKPAHNMISHLFHWAIITVILKKSAAFDVTKSCLQFASILQRFVICCLSFLWIYGWICQLILISRVYQFFISNGMGWPYLHFEPSPLRRFVMPSSNTTGSGPTWSNTKNLENPGFSYTTRKTRCLASNPRNF